MTRLVFAYPGDLDLPTGGYAYDRRLIRELRAAGWEVETLALGPGFPFPGPEARAAAEARLSALPDGTTVLIDGLAFGVLDDWALREAGRLAIFALVHHPLALEGGQKADVTAALLRSEHRALSAARGVVVTSPATGREVIRTFRVPEADVTVALPGTDPAPIALGEGDPPHVLSVGTLIPRKAHDVLVAALALNADLPWRATIIGSRTLHPETAEQVEAQIAEAGLGDRIRLVGTVSDTRAVMAGADVFALASRYEGYGMVFAEALAQGLPIVACAGGAVPEVVPASAGILAPPDDVPAFAEALRHILTDRDLRRSLAAGSRAAGAALPSWADTAATIASFIGSRT
ncbi:glycosyltransferase family 4 protein [Falsirhodobacter algicola]|uniref:Glycosyltransferase n=1 Tax=Falsirhodobacter algicola TaxID=2692330 RepID=A0A8J8MR99_9RHOB|nr:glycosyltransferase family 4 protein [Falsirhodobacter algicola]QUS35270.1 glycosyltransferase [Falsirhodobacter algicola]